MSDSIAGSGSAKGGWRAECRSYVGRMRQTNDLLSPRASNQLLATFDDDRSLALGDALPPLFHWLHFDGPVRTDALKDDGHEAFGDFLPPIPLPRRMWAGSEILFHRPLVLGREATRRSRVADVSFKSGKSGELCFVVVEHVHEQGGARCLTDRHTIVYREQSRERLLPKKANAEYPGATRSLSATELFRYSALTFNAHRIHLDRDYARDVEGYPGLVVHGPMMATLLMRHALHAEPSRLPARFVFRAQAPLFDGEGFQLERDGAAESADSSTSRENENALALRLRACDGGVCMSARLSWQDDHPTG